MSKYKLLGSLLIITGTAVGAGMLALPLATARIGFGLSIVSLLLIWFVTYISALLMLEITLAFKAPHNNYHTMSFKTLGKKGEIISWVSLLCLLYALCAAYVTGGGSILTQVIATYFEIEIPHWVSSTMFTLVIGSLVFWGTAIVDWCNRGLMLLKFIAFIIGMVLLMPSVNVETLSEASTSSYYFIAAFPILLTSFGFHPVIPSLAGYNNNDPVLLRKAITYGSLIPLVLYCIWEFVVKGIVPETGNISFLKIVSQGGSVGDLIGSVAKITQHRGIGVIMNVFSNTALATSFLGVSLALFDFLEDVVEKGRKETHRKRVAFLTFMPPLVFALFFPKGFLLALGYASLFVAFTCVIQPALMVMKLRRSKELHSPYRVSGGWLPIAVALFSGVLIIVIELSSHLFS